MQFKPLININLKIFDLNISLITKMGQKLLDCRRLSFFSLSVGVYMHVWISSSQLACQSTLGLTVWQSGDKSCHILSDFSICRILGSDSCYSIMKNTFWKLQITLFWERYFVLLSLLNLLLRMLIIFCGLQSRQPVANPPIWQLYGTDRLGKLNCMEPRFRQNRRRS